MIADTISTVWNATGTGGQVLSTVFSWSNPISAFDADEVTLCVTPNYLDVGVERYLMRVQWSADVPGYRWVDDTFAIPASTQPANVVEIAYNEWSFRDLFTQIGVISLPAQAHFIRVAFRELNATAGLSTVYLDVERHRTSPTQN
jgi:hypothetical protein